jgi:cellulose synthase/poly-beta-1,6-N-acetylglucosamine synthase-like glycosyltransferase
MISVCMATKNGEAFLREQLASILQQLSVGDEVVISDDSSTDATLAIIEDCRDPRIRVIKSTERGLLSNFENGLLHARGEFVFLADQDDVWLPHKVSTILGHLQDHELVVCDCTVTNSRLEVQVPSFFQWNQSKPGVIKNWWRNSYMGCCMAFHRGILKKALPFPKGVPIHDQWLGLIAELFFSVAFIKEPLVLHRRHESNASSTAGRSSLSIAQQFKHRYMIAYNLFQLKYA